jgi:hypothetical protein
MSRDRPALAARPETGTMNTIEIYFIVFAFWVVTKHALLGTVAVDSSDAIIPRGGIHAFLEPVKRVIDIGHVPLP